MVGAPSSLDVPIRPDFLLLADAGEGFFAKLTKRRLKRGVFHSVVALQQAINVFIENHNQQPTPFQWRAKPEDIIAAAKRGHQVLKTIH